ncbi:hypothetical protein EYS14_21625 [Alteromonadaceae bacterium M269]|nr:hypothetical protein EYS14_21625 [Alteromonadaceae bacterium M269]
MSQHKVVYIDMDDVLCDYSAAFNQALKATPEVAYPQSQYGFYANLLPIDGAIESVNKLISAEEYEPYILTAPSTMNPLCYTEKRVWIEKYFGIEFTEKLIISPNKALLKGELLIDDNASGRGQEHFDGEFIQFGTEAFPTWSAVCQYLGL